MLKIKVTKEKSVRVQTKGNLQELAQETLAVIHEIHRGIKAQNEEAALEYRRYLIGVMIAPDSPVWKED